MATLEVPATTVSQNRAFAMDRIAANRDYEIDLHAKLEIVRLHRRLDQMQKEVTAMVAILAKR